MPTTTTARKTKSKPMPDDLKVVSDSIQPLLRTWQHSGNGRATVIFLGEISPEDTKRQTIVEANSNALYVMFHDLLNHFGRKAAIPMGYALKEYVNGQRDKPRETAEIAEN